LHHAMRLSGYHGIPCGRPNYSNFGIAVLAEALARRAGIPYAELVTRRICQPLGLHATVATRQQCAEQRAIGYTSSGQRARPWDFDAMTGAAGLSSTVDD